MRVVRPLLGVLAVVAAIAASLAAAFALLGGGSDSPQSEVGHVAAPRPVAPSEDSSGDLIADDAAASWTTLARSLPARIGVAVAPLNGGATRTFGTLQTGHAWSTLKVPIAVTLMRGRGARGLNAEEKSWVLAALTASDNEAAAELFGQLEELHGGIRGASAAVQATLRSTGDDSTVVATAPPPSGAVSSFGQTEWSLSASVRLFGALGRGCLLGPRQTTYVLGLMEKLIPEQRWGLAGPGLPADWQVAAKGGWGPEGSASGPYLVRQAGVIGVGGTSMVVAAAAQADSGSFTDGVDALDRVADWLVANLRQSAAPTEPRC